MGRGRYPALQESSLREKFDGPGMRRPLSNLEHRKICADCVVDEVILGGSPSSGVSEANLYAQERESGSYCLKGSGSCTCRLGQDGFHGSSGGCPVLQRGGGQCAIIHLPYLFYA